jgi:hypothetical protein
VLVQEGKLVPDIFPPLWDDVVRDEIMLMQEGNLAHARFPPW